MGVSRGRHRHFPPIEVEQRGTPTHELGQWSPISAAHNDLIGIVELLASPARSFNIKAQIVAVDLTTVLRL